MELRLTSLTQDNLLKTLALTYNNAIRVISGLLLPNQLAQKPTCYLSVTKPLLLSKSAPPVFLKGPRKPDKFASSERMQTALANFQLSPVAGLHWIVPRSWSAKRPQISVNIMTHFRKQCNPTEVQTTVREVKSRNLDTHEVRYTDG